MAEQIVQNQPQVEAPQATPGTEATAPPVRDTYTKTEVEALFTERYKTIQRTVSEKDRMVQALQKEVTQLRTQTTPDVTSVVGVLRKKAVEDNDPKTLAELDAIERLERDRQAQRDYLAQVARQSQTAQEQRIAMEQRIRDAGQDPDDPRFDGVWAEHKIALKSGDDFSEATRLLDRRLVAAAKAPPAAPKETEEAMRERIKREVMVEQGLLEPEKLPVSQQGGGSSKVFYEDQVADYDFFIANKKAIESAQNEGRIRKR